LQTASGDRCESGDRCDCERDRDLDLAHCEDCRQ
jgi:hypothetical protein